jgi:molybdopterin molybdotransferase
MITADDAWRVICSETRPLPSIRMPLARCVGFVLAAPVVADRDIPAADRSCMDGYAVRSADITSTPVVLTLNGEIAAGSSSAPAIGHGQCARILTGASVPPGADTVVKQEDQEDGGDTVTIRVAPSPGANILARGESACSGSTLLDIGALLGPSQVSVCAAVGEAEPLVFRRPSVAILSTGTELRQPHENVASHQIRDSNGPALRAALSDAGYASVTAYSVSDDLAATSSAIGSLLQTHDALLITGGVSVGRYDYVPAAVQAAGGKIHYHGLSMKPGKPQVFATFPEGGCLFGLPGNPLGTLNGFWELALPALHRLSGRREEDCRPVLRVHLTEDVVSRGKRQHFLPARLLPQRDGMAAQPVRFTGSADLVAAGQADGTIIMPPGAGSLPAHAVVDFRRWGGRHS